MLEVSTRILITNCLVSPLEHPHNIVPTHATTTLMTIPLITALLMTALMMTALTTTTVLMTALNAGLITWGYQQCGSLADHDSSR